MTQSRKRGALNEKAITELDNLRSSVVRGKNLNDESLSGIASPSRVDKIRTRYRSAGWFKLLGLGFR